MEIVMPRAFSSGALSIWSKAEASLRLGNLSCSTFVMAAVTVVLPWSMWPMVPMLTCGLVRSNLALAIWPVSFSAGLRLDDGWSLGQGWVSWRGLLAPDLRDDLLRHVAGHLGVGVELHAVARPALRLRPEVADVAEHL